MFLSVIRRAFFHMAQCILYQCPPNHPSFFFMKACLEESTLSECVLFSTLVWCKPQTVSTFRGWRADGLYLSSVKKEKSSLCCLRNHLFEVFKTPITFTRCSLWLQSFSDVSWSVFRSFASQIIPASHPKFGKGNSLICQPRQIMHPSFVSAFPANSDARIIVFRKSWRWRQEVIRLYPSQH